MAREPGPNKLGIDRQQKIYRNAGGNPCPRYAVLVNGPDAGECQLPAAANAGSLAGVSYGKADADEAVALSEHNYEKVRAAGPIALHSRVNVADAQGRIKAVNEAGGTAVTFVGIAEEEATAADQEIVVNLVRGWSRASGTRPQQTSPRINYGKEPHRGGKDG